MPFISSRTLKGYSCCFRDYEDEETPNGYMHGAELSFKIMFEADDAATIKTVESLLETIEGFLDESFNYTTVVAQDDECMEAFDSLDTDGAIDLVVLQEVSLEAFAKTVFDYVGHLLEQKRSDLLLHSVECREHDGNSAIYAREDTVIEFTEQKEAEPQ